jgi:hypothetical protein
MYSASWGSSFGSMNILDAGVCMKIVLHIEDTDTQMEDFWNVQNGFS